MLLLFIIKPYYTLKGISNLIAVNKLFNICFNITMDKLLNIKLTIKNKNYFEERHIKIDNSKKLIINFLNKYSKDK
jgi:hypothetical protein